MKRNHLTQENFLAKLRRAIDKNQDIYIVSSDVSSTINKISEFLDYEKFHFLDLTDVCIGVKFKENALVIVDNEKALLEQLLKHEINYFSKF